MYTFCLLSFEENSAIVLSWEGKTGFRFEMIKKKFENKFSYFVSATKKQSYRWK